MLGGMGHTYRVALTREWYRPISTRVVWDINRMRGKEYRVSNVSVVVVVVVIVVVVVVVFIPDLADYLYLSLCGKCLHLLLHHPNAESNHKYIVQ